MKITIVTLFPKMISSFFEESIVKRAIDKKKVEIKIVNLRDFAIDEYGTVDDRPYGGGSGMILRVDVVHKAISKIKSAVPEKKLRSKILITSPKGRVFNQQKAIDLSNLDNLIIIAGHYEDVDARVLNFVDEEISMGDFVLTGGEIIAAAIVDSVVRLIPGVLKKENATTEESFSMSNQKLLEYPQYTRPENFQGLKVPEILLSGDHKKITVWQKKMSIEETKKKRPDLLPIDKI